MNKPKISVVVPIYNVEQYLDECLISIINQTLKDIEIICINDGSTDSSLAIINKYAANDQRIKVIDKENGGYGVGLNVGFDAAVGEYFAIVEPDDYIGLTMLETLYSVAKENQLDFVKSNYYNFRIVENTRDLEATHVFYSAKEDYNRVINPWEEKSILRGGIANWTGIYNIDFLKKNNIRHNETPGASYQDTGFFWQVFSHAERMMLIDDAYYMHRMDNPNSSTNDRKKIFCINIEYDFIKDNLMEDESVWAHFKDYYYYKKYYGYKWTIRRIAPEARTEFVERMRMEFKRADECDEIEYSLFKKNEENEIHDLLLSSQKYLDKYFNDNSAQKWESISRREVIKELKKAEGKINKLNKSKSYKIGRIISYVPRKIKHSK